MNDPINPNHYKKQPSVVEVAEGWGLSFTEGSILKYLARYKEKNGAEDLRKLIWYAERLIQNIEGRGK